MGAPLNLEVGISGSSSFAQRVDGKATTGEITIYESGSSGRASQGLPGWVVVAVVASAALVLFLLFRRR